jgi:hypothetical protein
LYFDLSGFNVEVFLFFFREKIVCAWHCYLQIEPGGRQGFFDGDFPFYYRLGVDGVEGSLQLLGGEARIAGAYRYNHHTVTGKGIGFYADGTCYSQSDLFLSFFNFLLDQKVAKNQGFRQIPTKRRSLR